ncbi:hypothetical protein TNIN_378121 [Trichonephila inaurata madagascariensis]|uniref:Uncharacterized protein n=1 Tax=Trichonephila inaurata madagascariensis TaxID=2747483 RepID=A0A8X6YJC0_9ARAC|nr:hypothetical protein TNIN_378121 [Trichonephila inaurata madagascariensis]
MRRRENKTTPAQCRIRYEPDRFVPSASVDAFLINQREREGLVPFCTRKGQGPASLVNRIRRGPPSAIDSWDPRARGGGDIIDELRLRIETIAPSRQPRISSHRKVFGPPWSWKQWRTGIEKCLDHPGLRSNATPSNKKNSCKRKEDITPSWS